MFSGLKVGEKIQELYRIEKKTFANLINIYNNDRNGISDGEQLDLQKIIAYISHDYIMYCLRSWGHGADGKCQHVG